MLSNSWTKHCLHSSRLDRDLDRALILRKYVAVRYETVASPVTYDFNECYPYQLPAGELAQVAVFCKSTTCYNNPCVKLPPRSDAEY